MRELKYNWFELIFLGKPDWVMYVAVSAAGVVVLAVLIGLFACCCTKRTGNKVAIDELTPEEPEVKSFGVE